MWQVCRWRLGVLGGSDLLQPGIPCKFPTKWAAIWNPRILKIMEADKHPFTRIPPSNIGFLSLRLRVIFRFSDYAKMAEMNWPMLLRGLQSFSTENWLWTFHLEQRSPHRNTNTKVQTPLVCRASTAPKKLWFWDATISSVTWFYIHWTSK